MQAKADAVVALPTTVATAASAKAKEITDAAIALPTTIAEEAAALPGKASQAAQQKASGLGFGHGYGCACRHVPVACCY